ncbi:hypothetical protein OG563_41440 [Nocardia vinacea]|uniref:Mce-associated membrane protein n=1 Tax=Nocardia vinacea TaxID=96468 RepID=A0ABZ1YU89_9NOCA|nr:hypothetical protein [Nocardia vinacea]
MDLTVDRSDSLTATDTAATTALVTEPPPRRRRATRPTGPPSESPEHPDVEADTDTSPSAAERSSATTEGPIRQPRRLPRIPRPRLARPKLGRRRFRIAAVVLAVAALAAATTVTALALREHRQTEATANHQAAIIDTARRGVTALINIRRDSADADFARLSDITTAPFADDLHSQSGNYLQAIRHADVLSTGEVIAAATAADDGAEVPDDGTITVIVAANAQVTNTQTRQQEQRSYRFSVRIKEVDGIPKVSNVEFVP